MCALHHYGTFCGPGKLHTGESAAAVPHLLHPFALDAKAGGWRNLIFSPTCSSSNSHYHTSESRREKCNRAPWKTDEGERSARARRETSEEIGAFRQSESVCVFVCFGCLEYIYLSVTHTVPLSARQSPCQFSGLHAPPVRACLGPQTEPLCGLRLDLVADQWDLGGQTDCHSIVPCMLPNLNLFVALLISALPA